MKPSATFSISLAVCALSLIGVPFCRADEPACTRVELKGSSIPRHVGTRGDIFEHAILPTVGSRTRIEPQLGRIVGTGSRLPGPNVPLVHELVLDAKLGIQESAPPGDYRIALHAVLYRGDELVTVLHVDGSLSKGNSQIRTVYVRDIFEIPESILEQVSTVDVCYDEQIQTKAD